MLACHVALNLLAAVAASDDRSKFQTTLYMFIIMFATHRKASVAPGSVSECCRSIAPIRWRAATSTRANLVVVRCFHRDRHGECVRASYQARDQIG
jgi:hypothetical protein